MFSDPEKLISMQLWELGTEELIASGLLGLLHLLPWLSSSGCSSGGSARNVGISKSNSSSNNNNSNNNNISSNSITSNTGINSITTVNSNSNYVTTNINNSALITSTDPLTLSSTSNTTSNTTSNSSTSAGATTSIALAPLLDPNQIASRTLSLPSPLTSSTSTPSLSAQKLVLRSFLHSFSLASSDLHATWSKFRPQSPSPVLPPYAKFLAQFPREAVKYFFSSDRILDLEVRTCSSYLNTILFKSLYCGVISFIFIFYSILIPSPTLFLFLISFPSYLSFFLYSFCFSSFLFPFSFFFNFSFPRLFFPFSFFIFSSSYFFSYAISY